MLETIRYPHRRKYLILFVCTLCAVLYCSFLYLFLLLFFFFFLLLLLVFLLWT
jgi:hypothetical protein